MKRYSWLLVVGLSVLGLMGCCCYPPYGPYHGGYYGGYYGGGYYGPYDDWHCPPYPPYPDDCCW
jgi:hypothetical protein